MTHDQPFLPLDLSAQQIHTCLTDMLQRHAPAPGHRQVPFNRVETLLCYGLFYVLDPHRFGGANIATVPPVVKTLAAFFRRTPGSIISKMLNLDGSRLHSAREEPWLFASLAAAPALYRVLYQNILTTARTLSITPDILPDFLPAFSPSEQAEALVGQDDLPPSTATLLVGLEETLNVLDQTFALGDQLTEKLVEHKIRLAQHRFAFNVLQNCGNTCVFCGFAPHTLPRHSGLLRASHIKPWAVSSDHERVDVRNGLAACPMHDAAFDEGYLTVNGGYRIHQASVLRESVAHDQGVLPYFGTILRPSLLLPQHAQKPGRAYLLYHQAHIFRR